MLCRIPLVFNVISQPGPWATGSHYRKWRQWRQRRQHVQSCGTKWVWPVWLLAGKPQDSLLSSALPCFTMFYHPHPSTIWDTPWHPLIAFFFQVAEKPELTALGSDQMTFAGVWFLKLSYPNMGCQSDRISMRKKRWLVRPPMLHDIVPCLNLRKMNKVVPVFMFTSRLDHGFGAIPNWRSAGRRFVRLRKLPSGASHMGVKIGWSAFDLIFIWRCPKMGVPPVDHPSKYGIFHEKKTIINH